MIRPKQFTALPTVLAKPVAKSLVSKAPNAKPTPIQAKLAEDTKENVQIYLDKQVARVFGLV